MQRVHIIVTKPRPHMQCSTQALADMVEGAAAALRQEIIHELKQRKGRAARRLLETLSGPAIGAGSSTAPVQASPRSKTQTARPLKSGINTQRPKHAPTAEQAIAIGKFQAGGSLKMRAFAGAGKTSTLQFFADRRPTRGLYLAFNKAIATEAQQRFPGHVHCCTTHSLAARFARGHGYTNAKLFHPIHAKELAQVLALKDLVIDAQTTLTPVQQAHALLQGIRRFCNSDAATLSSGHVDVPWRMRAAAPYVRETVTEQLAVQCAALWARMTAPEDPIPLGHDGYLKLWNLSEPVLEYDYVFVDEAQDTNKAVLSVFKRQRETQMVYVGDGHQQIYEWRQAVNAMDDVATEHEAVLSQSFRFGPAIADAANRVLRTLGETTPLHGFDKIDSRITTNAQTRAVLARTNATVISEALAALEQNRKPHIVGGTSELKEWLTDAKSLMEGQPGQRPELFGFTNWQQVIDFSATDEGESVRRFVTLVQTNGTGRLWQAVLNATDNEAKADVVISTAHKAKGCEWDSVRIAEDFAACKSDDEQIPAAEARLFYVAITRAKLNLSIDPALLAAFASGRMADLEKLKAARVLADRPVSAKQRPEAAPVAHRRAPMPAAPAIKPPVTVATAPPSPEVRPIRAPAAVAAPRLVAVPPPQAKPRGLLSRIMGW